MKFVRNNGNRCKQGMRRKLCGVALAKKRIKSNLTRSALMIVIFSILIATLFSTMSLSIDYAKSFLNMADEINEEPYKLFKEGASNVSNFMVYIAKLLGRKIVITSGGVEMKWDDELYVSNNEQTRSENAPVLYDGPGLRQNGTSKRAPSAYSMFSARACCVNLSVNIIIILLLVLLCARTVISIIFSVYKKDRRKFFATLMVSGADEKYIRSTARWEGFYLFAASLPIGLVFGSAEILAAKQIISNVYGNISEKLAVSSDILNIKINVLAALAAALFAMVNILQVSKKACKKLHFKNIAFELKSCLTANIGNRTFSAKEKAYQRHGIAHYVGARSFSGGIERYIKVFLITAICMGLNGISLIFYTIAKNYNDFSGTESYKKMLLTGLVSKTFACSAAVFLSVLMLICLFCVLVSNSETNKGMYMAMVSLGSSIRSAKRCITTESRVCMAIGIFCGTFSIFWFWNFIIENYYMYNSNISFKGGTMILTSVGVLIALYIATVVSAIVYSSAKLKKADVIKFLKENSY